MEEIFALVSLCLMLMLPIIKAGGFKPKDTQESVDKIREKWEELF